MKSFTFRLERILRLRTDAERQQARRLGEATQEEARLDALVQDQATYLERIGDRLAQQPGDRTSAGWLRVLTLTADAAAQQLQESARSRERARESVDALRERLPEARVERMSQERLRDRQEGTWKDSERREERSAMDEIAGRRHDEESAS
jgi:flagellar export protein FliJ